MDDATTTPAIDVKALRVTYRARRKQPAREAVRSLDLVIEPGQFVALLGPNGSGKSSLIRAVAGLVPFEGSVSVHGERDLGAIRRQLGVVLQSPSLDPNMTVRENLRDVAALYGLSREIIQQRMSEELSAAAMTIHAGALVKRLSGGLRRRADLIRAVLHRPRVLLLDEPTVGLDPPSRRSFLEAIEARRERDGATIVISTHLIDEADRADRVVFMHEGAIVADDAPAALRSQLGERTLTVMSPLKPIIPWVEWKRTSQGWSAGSVEDAEQRAAIIEALTTAGLAFTVAPPTLADAFESLTGASLHGDRHDG